MQLFQGWKNSKAAAATWAQDGTLTTYLTPSGYSNIIVPDIIRLGANSGTEYATQEWQESGALGGGLIVTSGKSGNTGYHQWFQQSNRIMIAGFSSVGRVAVNSNSFDGSAVGGYNAIAHLRARDAATEAGLLVTLPTSPSNTIHVLRVADASNLFYYMDNTGRSYGPNGTAAAPSISFGNDPDCGVYRVTTNEIGVATNGARVASFNATQFVLPTGRSEVLFNTADEVTNPEYLRIGWTSSTAMIGTEVAGSGTIRTLQLYANGNASGTSFAAFYIRRSGTGQFFEFDVSGTGAVGPLFNIMRTSNPLVASSGTQIVHAITPAVTQTSTAGWTMSFINVTDNLVSSGARNFVDYQLNSVSNFRVSHLGAVTGLSYTSGNPSGGTAEAWRFGGYTAGAPTATGYLLVQAGAAVYRISAELVP